MEPECVMVMLVVDIAEPAEILDIMAKVGRIMTNGMCNGNAAATAMGVTVTVTVMEGAMATQRQQQWTT